MLRILGRANSFNVRKVLWVCDELGVAFEREDWGRGYQSTSDPRFLELNPIGLVPAVIDDGVVLRESNTIVRYLATKHGSEAIYPRDPVTRAHVEQWMDWANYETSISLRGAFLGGMLNEPPWNNPWFVDVERRQITKEVGQLEQHLARAGPYIVGNAFTIADIPVGLVVNRWFCLSFELPEYPAVAAYYDQTGRAPGLSASRTKRVAVGCARATQGTQFVPGLVALSKTPIMGPMENRLAPRLSEGA